LVHEGEKGEMVAGPHMLLSGKNGGEREKKRAAVYLDVGAGKGGTVLGVLVDQAGEGMAKEV